MKKLANLSWVKVLNKTEQKLISGGQNWKRCKIVIDCGDGWYMNEFCTCVPQPPY